ncbi:MAG: hypothetical protein PVG32_10580 [Anaerolineales bacterium]|jgi:hypothetical protein
MLSLLATGGGEGVFLSLGEISLLECSASLRDATPGVRRPARNDTTIIVGLADLDIKRDLV